MSAFDEAWSEPALDPTTRQFVETGPGTRHFQELPPAEARAAFSQLQSSPVGKPSARIDDTTFPLGPTGSVPVRIVRPRDADGLLPALIYCHGGGWVSGGVDTHDRLIREIAIGANTAVVFVDYDRAPEAQYPVAIEQVHGASLHLVANADELGIDATRLAIAGEGTGGTIAAAVTLLARERRRPKFELQVLICPVTDADFSFESYQRFADGPWLTRAAMEQAWNAYLPDAAGRTAITAAPLRASIEQLAGLPDALVIVADNDVTRDEGECYAQKLSDAGVRITSIRYNGTIHDFVVLNALSDTPAARGAIAQIISALNVTLG